MKFLVLTNGRIYRKTTHGFYTIIMHHLT